LATDTLLVHLRDCAHHGQDVKQRAIDHKLGHSPRSRKQAGHSSGDARLSMDTADLHAPLPQPAYFNLNNPGPLEPYPPPERWPIDPLLHDSPTQSYPPPSPALSNLSFSSGLPSHIGMPALSESGSYSQPLTSQSHSRLPSYPTASWTASTPWTST